MSDTIPTGTVGVAAPVLFGAPWPIAGPVGRGWQNIRVGVKAKMASGAQKEGGMRTHAYIANGRGTGGPPRGEVPGVRPYSGHHSPHVTQGYPPPSTTGASGTQVGSMPDTASLPQLPVSLPSPGLDILAVAATMSQAKTLLPQAVTPALTSPGQIRPHHCHQRW